MTLEGVDFSDGRPGGKALAAAGKRFVVRYLAYKSNPDPHKPLTRGEIADYQANGLAIVANFESTANRMLDGAVAGAADANDARADMLGLGFPTSCPVYFSADFDPQPAYLARIDAYLAAAGGVLGKARVGIYGGIDALTHVRSSGTATWFWQAAGWNHGRQPPTWCHLWQYQTAGQGAPPINGASVDNDRALKDNYGQWDAPSGGGPAQPIGGDVIYTRGGLKTAVVVAGTGYAREPGGPIVATIQATARFLCLAFDVTGQYVALDGNYLDPQTTQTTPCGWVTTGQLTSVADALVVDCAAAVEAATAPLEAKIAEAQKVLNG